MTRTLLFTLILSLLGGIGHTQDTLAWQDFETVPGTPTWTYTGPVVFNQGFPVPLQHRPIAQLVSMDPVRGNQPLSVVD